MRMKFSDKMEFKLSVFIVLTHIIVLTVLLVAKGT